LKQEKMMGQITDAKIAAWQKKAGIEPAKGKYRTALDELSEACFYVIKIIELERSGIRDGDGGWHGSDVTGYAIEGLAGQCARVMVFRGDEQPPTSAADTGSADEM
jgi:hypothetical protein